MNDDFPMRGTGGGETWISPACWDGLAKAATDGGPHGMDDLMAAVNAWARKYAEIRLGGRDLTYLEPADVAQEICLAVFVAVPGHGLRGGSFLFLLRAIAANKVADAFRKASRSKQVLTGELPERPAVAADEPEQRALRTDLGVRLGRLMRILPVSHREVLGMRVIGELTSNETAAALGTTSSRVRVTKHRAISRLRARAQRRDALS
ncbi:RNA polymerase subunit sigma [Amycolatopsis sp. WAC 01375]|uniref:sigma-70 family RNA polymerase sigma factor n=1 Tax=unclassified Amycolatopsis TaxID=2618356 RepID=UPI000F78D5CB|nr:MULTISPECIES: sigma-70 family RNA polymerase sigma factor [unclassified Amycolatopsis]RSM81879.1 RNA polymerase subunit sigma [Amycolatopsis sp. WAC 01375]RSN23633.1 RNA polymerase subunit sigma [Amycolatopsis sp. WAC 01416]